MSLEVRNYVSDIHWGNKQEPLKNGGKQFFSTSKDSKTWELTPITSPQFNGLKKFLKPIHILKNYSHSHELKKALNAEGITPISTSEIRETETKSLEAHNTKFEKFGEYYEITSDGQSKATILYVTQSNVTEFIKTEEGQSAAKVVEAIKSIPICTDLSIELNKAGMSPSEPTKLMRCPLSNEVLTPENTIQAELINTKAFPSFSFREKNLGFDRSKHTIWVTVSKSGLRSHLLPQSQREFSLSKVAIVPSLMDESSVREARIVDSTNIRREFK
ncbi:hypothetical protein D5R81_03760 [Parashewanella spongiae]|uniref:Uncharacterized protein n=1 Tax=Parashewanella spongiae TaxID=342950 RepID=A0A3A6TRM9_9GAMM|nr:hypothetical protein [Parashewanella spongiae]MCL1078844.1 hypothetical protein [Parashewanella spongiae]RJY18795.1 hypothetical protein D5R81_03760 [Parashewanella spongiae]